MLLSRTAERIVVAACLLLQSGPFFGLNRNPMPRSNIWGALVCGTGVPKETIQGTAYSQMLWQYNISTMALLGLALTASTGGYEERPFFRLACASVSVVASAFLHVYMAKRVMSAPTIRLGAAMCLVFLLRASWEEMQNTKKSQAGGHFTMALFAALLAAASCRHTGTVSQWCNRERRKNPTGELIVMEPLQLPIPPPPQATEAKTTGTILEAVTDERQKQIAKAAGDLR